MNVRKISGSVKSDVTDARTLNLVDHPQREIITLRKREVVLHAPKDKRPKSKDKTPQLQNLADVRIVPVRWLWPDRLPLAKLSLISGDPGTGKSCLTIDLAARVSAGIRWPDVCEESNPVGGVVLLSAEDALDDTVVPRLRAAGADLTRIVALQGVEYRGKSGDEVRHFNLEHDLPVLESAIEQCPGCRLVVLDPVSAYLGETDSHRNAEVRGLLAPLATLDELAVKINDEHRQAEAAVRTAVEHVVRAGDLLIEAKGRCEHGKWGYWVADNCKFSDRTARMYMRVAREPQAGR